MGVQVYPIKLGITRCYIIEEQGAILVDCGMAGKAQAFAKALETIPVQPEDIRLIVATHGHWDHIGSAKEIREITRSKIAMHPNILKPVPVRVHISLLIFPESTCHANPWLPDHQFTYFIEHRISIFIQHISVHTNHWS